MSNRLTQIATRTGDDGSTGLGDGSRVSKGHLRVAAMGDVDELNSTLGVLLAEPLPDGVRELLVTVRPDEGRVTVAGQAVTVFKGHLFLPKS